MNLFAKNLNLIIIIVDRFTGESSRAHVVNSFILKLWKSALGNLARTSLAKLCFFTSESVGTKAIERTIVQERVQFK